jgi:hypothetical protein
VRKCRNRVGGSGTCGEAKPSDIREPAPVTEPAFRDAQAPRIGDARRRDYGRAFGIKAVSKAKSQSRRSVAPPFSNPLYLGRQRFARAGRDFLRRMAVLVDRSIQSPTRPSAFEAEAC